MKRQYIYTLAVLLLYSCNSSEGLIEIRQQRFYLVNKSFTKSYRFTIKQTEIREEKWYKYSTDLIELAPGEERFLGEEMNITKTEYQTLEKSEIKLYKPMSDQEIEKEKRALKKRKNPFTYSPLYNEELFAGALDTIINGEQYKYRYAEITYKDSTHPIPSVHFKYEYKVVGQVEVSPINNR